MKVVIPETVESIGSEAFQGCTSLESIYIPENVTSIGYDAFRGCTKLSNVEIEDSKEKKLNIFDGVFSSCLNLKEIQLPEKTVYLGSNFIGGTGITSIVIPKNVENCGTYGALGGASKLEEVVFEEGIQTIPSRMCSGNTGIMKVVIPETVESIGSEAFRGCTSLTIYGYSGSYAETYAIANNIPFVSLGEMIGNCEYDYSDVLDRWLLDQGTSNSMNYLVHDENFTNSLTVAANDKSFGMRLTEALSNMIYRGMDGWKEIMARETSRKQARDILLALMELQCEQVEQLAQVQTAKKYADIYIKTFKQANWAYAIDYGLNSKEIEQLSKVCQKSEIEQFFLDSKYDTIESYLLAKGNFKADSNVLKCIKSFGQSEKYLKTLSEGSKWLGRGLKVINTTDKTIKKAYELESLQKTDELYSEMLAYIRDNCSFMAVSQAADDLYGAIHGGYMDEMSYVTSELVDVTEDIVIDEILDAASATLPYGTLVKGTFDFSAGLANIIFHTGDTQEQADNMRCVAYIGKSLASWMTECRLKYLTGSGSEKSDYARRTVYAYYMLLKTRMAGEVSLQKNMELSRTSWKRAYTVSKEISATLESNEKWLNSSGALKVISTSVVACPVNVGIYDASGNLVVTLADGSETEGYIGDIYYKVSYNPLSDDYVKIIRTPVNGGYTLKCDATDMGKVDFYTSVVSDEGVTVANEVDNIPVEKGKTIVIPDTSGNDTQCTVVNKNQTEERYEAKESSKEYIPVTAIQGANNSLEMKLEEQIRIDVKIIPENATIQDIQWSSSDEKIVTVNSDGVVSSVGLGEAVITAKALKENVSMQIKVTVKKEETAGDQKKDIASCKISLAATSVKYSGKAQTPKVSVKDGKKVLQKNKDYTVAYDRNVKIGTARVTIKGKGSYTGKKVLSFKIIEGAHKWKKVRTIKAATVLSPKIEEHKCSNCGAIKRKKVGKKLTPILKVSASSVKLKKGQSTAGLKVTKMQKGDAVVSWKSGNNKIVKVSSKGKLTAQKRTGKTYVIVKLKSGISKKITVTVQKDAVKTTKITGLNSKIILKKGKQ